MFIFTASFEGEKSDMRAVLDWLSPGVAMLNIGMSLWFAWEIKRMRRLEFLLDHLCISTFTHQHLPIWRAWSQAFGYAFKVSIVRQASDKMSDGEA